MKPLPFATVRSYVGCGARNLIEKALEGETSSLDEALAFFLEHYQAHLLDQTLAYPGIPELLETLSKRGITMTVLTNKPQVHAEAVLKGLNLDKYFQGIFGGDSFPSRKPDPAGLLSILTGLDIALDDALMIGDSDNDVLTAHHAGIWSLGVTYGYGPESVKNAEPDVQVSTIEELRNTAL